MTNEELKHYGIPGMKWGVRRYQNEDGSLTPLGRRRKGEEIDAVNSYYTRLNKKHKKTLEKAKTYKKSEKRSKRKDDRWKEKERFANRMIEGHKALADAEIKKIKKTPIKDLINSRYQERGKRLTTALLNTAGMLSFMSPIGIGVFRKYDATNNFLTNQEINSVLLNNKNFTDLDRYQLYKDSHRGMNRRSKKK